MFEFNVKPQKVTLSFIESESTAPSIYGTPPTVLQAVMTFGNGRSWVLPLPFLLQLIEPSDAEAEIFLDGLRARFDPKPEPLPMSPLHDTTMDVIPKEDGGFRIRTRESPRKS